MKANYDPKLEDKIHHLLEKLDTPRKELTKWEENFIQSITEQFMAKGYLSERQLEILEKIVLEKG
jgi:uncharacterized membrane-anchored protein